MYHRFPIRLKPMISPTYSNIKLTCDIWYSAMYLQSQKPVQKLWYQKKCHFPVRRPTCHRRNGARTPSLESCWRNLLHSIGAVASLLSPIRKSAQELDWPSVHRSHLTHYYALPYYAPPYYAHAKGLRILCGFAHLFGCDPLRYRLGLSRFGSKKGMATWSEKTLRRNHGQLKLQLGEVDIVRIRREVKGRKGKTVTALFAVPLDDKKLQQFMITSHFIMEWFSEKRFGLDIYGVEFDMCQISGFHLMARDRR